jgi:hypothetical protein
MSYYDDFWKFVFRTCPYQIFKRILYFPLRVRVLLGHHKLNGFNKDRRYLRTSNITDIPGYDVGRFWGFRIVQRCQNSLVDYRHHVHMLIHLSILSRRVQTDSNFNGFSQRVLVSTAEFTDLFIEYVNRILCSAVTRHESLIRLPVRRSV